MRRIVIGAVVLAVLGLAAISGGVHLLTTTDVGCGARAMRPGEVCESALPRGRGSVVLDYEEQRSSNKRVGYVAIGFGVLALGYTAWSVGRAVRSQRRRSHEAA